MREAAVPFAQAAIDPRMGDTGRSVLRVRNIDPGVPDRN